ncbi:DUF4127 family protein [Halobacillus fulvus]|nr:DUF4127 family protein [Halobacillus fulvus]
MKKKIALLPVDGRPVTRELPIELGQLAGWDIYAPEPEELGFLKKPANTSDLKDWLSRLAEDVDGFVLSIDMLLYGGLVPSRMHPYTKQELLGHLSILREWKDAFPTLSLMAFSSTMRLSNNNYNEEEKEYWKDYGTDLWSLSYHAHRYERLNQDEDRKLAEEMESKIPADIVKDYKATRAINFSVNLELMKYVEEGVLDHLVFPQDDTSEYGWNISEQEQLKKRARERMIGDSVFIYPGADEVASTLMTRMIFRMEGEALPTFFPVYSGMTGALSTAMYEDRPLLESVKGQLTAVGSRTEDDMQEADIVLGVNVPGQEQGDLALGIRLHLVDSNHRNVDEWLSRLQAYQARKPIAVADVAYANGADPILFPGLLSQLEWKKWLGFAAWNTAGNTLGTVVSQASLMWLAEKRGLQVEELRQKQLILRMLDDYIYQTIVRKEGRAVLQEETEQTLQEWVTPLFKKHAAVFLQSYAPDWNVADVYYPWERTFEIGMKLEKEERI